MRTDWNFRFSGPTYIRSTAGISTSPSPLSFTYWSDVVGIGASVPYISYLQGHYPSKYYSNQNYPPNQNHPPEYPPEDPTLSIVTGDLIVNGNYSVSGIQTYRYIGKPGQNLNKLVFAPGSFSKSWSFTNQYPYVGLVGGASKTVKYVTTDAFYTTVTVYFYGGIGGVDLLNILSWTTDYEKNFIPYYRTPPVKLSISSLSPNTTTITGINTLGIFVGDYIWIDDYAQPSFASEYNIDIQASGWNPPYQDFTPSPWIEYYDVKITDEFTDAYYVTAVNQNGIVLNKPTTNTGTVNGAVLRTFFLDNFRNAVELEKLNPNLEIVNYNIGIGSTAHRSSSLKFTYYEEEKVDTATDYGDLLDVTRSFKSLVGVGTTVIDNTIVISTPTSGITTENLSIGQYLKQVRGVFDNETESYIVGIGETSLTINVGSSNTTPKITNIVVGNLIQKETNRYSYNPLSSYTIDFLTKFKSGIDLENLILFPIYGNPPGSSNEDPSLRYKYSMFLPTSWDINKVLGVKDYLALSYIQKERLAARGRRNYKGIYPRHIFGR